MMSQTVSPADGSSLLGVTQESFVSENGGVVAVNLGSAASSLASRAGFLIFDDKNLSVVRLFLLLSPFYGEKRRRM